jgi:sugar transferase (PEP-CTERM/EpsH1 system associated)
MGEILFLCHRLPFPPNRGDKIRSHHLLRRLAALGPVHVGTFRDDDGDVIHEADLSLVARSWKVAPRTRALPLAGIEALARRLPVSLTAFYDPALAQWVEQTLRLHPINTIVVFSGQMGQYVPASWKGRLIVDFVDADSAKFDAYAADGRWPMRWVHAREGRLLLAEEERLARLADVSLLVSEAEAGLFRARLREPARCDVRALGNGIDTAAFDPALVQPEPELAALAGPPLIFTGQMDYPPNVAAAVRATQRIMPLVRRAFPGATFHVVGRKPTAQVVALNGVNGCRVHGAVPDVRPWLRGADLALAPLEIARGVQNKVLEAMAMALPVVASTQAATGIAAVPGRDFAVGLTDAELAAAVIVLLTERAQARAMGLAARRFVETHHNWDAVLGPLARMLDAPRRAAPPAGKGRRHPSYPHAA